MVQLILTATVCTQHESQVHLQKPSPKHLCSCIAGIQVLAPVFGQLTALEHLDLCKQQMGADGIAALAVYLSRLSHLTCLELDSNNLGLAGASELAMAASSGGLPALEVCIATGAVTWGEIVGPLSFLPCGHQCWGCQVYLLGGYSKGTVQYLGWHTVGYRNCDQL